jgi:sigma-E factor negative regulatory protein RseA
MSKETLEHLSSLMDGEISKEAGLFLTRRLSSDEAMCETWERYHLIRDCIRQPGSKQVVIGLSAKLNASLSAEEQLPVRTRTNYRWLKPVSGLAIAASVAMVAIVATAPQSIVVTGALESANEASVQPFVSPNSSLLSPPSQAVNFEPNYSGNWYLSQTRLVGLVLEIIILVE